MSTLHQFKIGQNVQIRNSYDAFYRIIGTLPSKDGSPQYRVQNLYENHERVIMQNLIELAPSPSSQLDEAMIAKTFVKSKKVAARSSYLNAKIR